MYKKKYLILLHIVFIIKAADFLYAKGKKTIAVFDFASKDIPAKYNQIIRNEIEFFLFNTKKFKVLEREKIDLISKEHYIKAHGSKRKQAITVGKTLAADFAVTGAINISNTIDTKDKFKLRIKIININDGTILGTYSNKFEKLAEINKLIQKVSKDISEDISFYNRHGRIKSKQKEKIKLMTNKTEKQIYSANKKYDNSNFIINTGFVYFFPFGIFSETVKYGYGLFLDAGFMNIIINNLLVGIETGYYRLKSRVGEFDRFILIPLLIKLKIQFSFLKRFFLYPNISAGVNVISNEFDEGKSARNIKGIKGTSIEPMLQGGVNFGITLTKDIIITAGSCLGAIWERDETMYFLTYSLKIRYQF